ncbi:hypothetical protein HOY80DRAFT_304920 [Tuber brumale]|nr:hypothetical protein HOY80DRAFT_304920 [Tuber brumale]
MRYLPVTRENTNRIHVLISWQLCILLGQANEGVYLISNLPSRYRDANCTCMIKSCPESNDTPSRQPQLPQLWFKLFNTCTRIFVIFKFYRLNNR